MITCAAVIKDHMVLQQGKPVPIWGTTDCDTLDLAIMDGDRMVASADVQVTPEGVFWGLFPSLFAGGPYTLLISSGEEKKVFSDVYVGEVFLAGGQSNMELELQNSLDGAKAAAKMNHPLIRYYYTPKVSYVGEELFAAEQQSSWQLCTPGEGRAWSAAGYYFARELADRLQVMVGIIGCNWGGTSASCWIAAEELKADSLLKEYVTRYEEAVAGKSLDEYLKELEAYEVYQAEFDRNVANYYQTNPNPSWEEAISLFGENRYPGPMGPRNWTRPGGLYESMLSRIAPYALRGVLFYQGEEDDNRPCLYGHLLEKLICSWRDLFADRSLPFFLAQLPIFCNEGEDDYKNWPFIREAQADASRMIPGVACACLLDLGEYHNIHPLNKEAVGKRMAAQALYHLYGAADFENKISGPSYASCMEEGDRLALSFYHAEKGISFRGEEASDTWGFEVAGEDGVYYPADVAPGFFRNMIYVSSPKVECPRKARYFWKNYGIVSVYGANGLPMMPFRTDLLDGARPLGSRQGEVFFDGM